MLLETRASVHSFLRRATMRVHGRMEGTSVLAALLIPGVTLLTYRTAMRALEGAYDGIDSWLVESSDLCPRCLPAYSPRGTSIRHDLVALGEENGSDGAAPSARAGRPRDGGHGQDSHAKLRALETEAEYLGVRYVVEGAQHGSKMIHRALRSTFGEKLTDVGSFWQPGSELQQSWPGLLKGLELIQSRDSLAAAARAARITFRHMEKFLSANESRAR